MNVAKVILFNSIVGFIKWNDSRGLAEFEYAPEFISKGIEPSPLMMPVKKGIVYSFPDLKTDCYRGLPGMIADSLPDRYGRALMKAYLSAIGKKEENPLESLCYLGSRCMGALEFEPAYKGSPLRNNQFEISSLVEVAAQALNEKASFSTNVDSDRKQAIADILSLSTSAGGQRAKAVIAYNKKTGEVRSGQIPSPEGFKHYIIKLDGISAGQGLNATHNYGRLEYSFYLLALQCGIDIKDSFLIEENGRAHFVTERFDRIGNEKIHMQTLCGLAHYDYGMLRAFSWEQAFSIMRMLGLSYSELEQAFKRILFNIIIRNQDDHTKNISFLMSPDGKWSLSPAYDLGYNFNPYGNWTNQHQMSVNGKFDNINRADLLAFADNNDIADANNIIDDISEQCGYWPEIAKKCLLAEDTISQKYNNFIKL